MTSTNERAEALMGRRLTPEQEATGVVAFDQPSGLGYRCPVCDRSRDEDLTWSEYNGFLWCGRCDRDWPSALCVPLDATPDPERPWVQAGPDAAVDVFLNSVKDALTRITANAPLGALIHDPEAAVRAIATAFMRRRRTGYSDEGLAGYIVTLLTLPPGSEPKETP